MKITVYTIKDCQFSKAEKEYLKSHNLPYEEKGLEADKSFLTEMLAISNNFAGTPVTKIEKDDGAISILKGFTKEEFDRVLGYESKPIPTDLSAEASAKVDSTDSSDEASTKADSNRLQQSEANPSPVTSNQSPALSPAPVSKPTLSLSTDVPTKVEPPQTSQTKPAISGVMNKLETNMASAQPQAPAGAVVPPPTQTSSQSISTDLSADSSSVSLPKEEASAKVDSTDFKPNTPSIPDFPSENKASA